MSLGHFPSAYNSSCRETIFSRQPRQPYTARGEDRNDTARAGMPCYSTRISISIILRTSGWHLPQFGTFAFDSHELGLFVVSQKIVDSTSTIICSRCTHNFSGQVCQQVPWCALGCVYRPAGVGDPAQRRNSLRLPPPSKSKTRKILHHTVRVRSIGRIVSPFSTHNHASW